jgi:transposase
MEYDLNITIEEDPEKTEKIRLEAGSFVLITNVLALGKKLDCSDPEIICLYKEQDGNEKNFGFLKDPAISNAIFLEKSERIKALELILYHFYFGVCLRRVTSLTLKKRASICL